MLCTRVCVGTVRVGIVRSNSSATDWMYMGLLAVVNLLSLSLVALLGKETRYNTLKSSSCIQAATEIHSLWRHRCIPLCHFMLRTGLYLLLQNVIKGLGKNTFHKKHELTTEESNSLLLKPIREWCIVSRSSHFQYWSHLQCTQHNPAAVVCRCRYLWMTSFKKSWASVTSSSPSLPARLSLIS